MKLLDYDAFIFRSALLGLTLNGWNAIAMLSFAEIGNVEIRELSMGVSDNLDVAIEEMSIIACIGRTIFGERLPKAPAGVSGDGIT